MIDYEKLTIAHELCCRTKLTFDIRFGFHKPTIFLMNEENGVILITCCINELIGFLTKLTAVEPKYNVGQEIWYLNCDKDVCSGNIQGIDVTSFEEIMYFITEHGFLPDEQVYPSKEAMVEAQIEYWKSLKTPIVVANKVKEYIKNVTLAEKCGLSVQDICAHEPDGLVHALNGNDERCFITLKCKKCGEIY